MYCFFWEIKGISSDMDVVNHNPFQLLIHFNCSPLWTLINLTFYLYHVCHSAPQKSSVSFKRHLMVSLGGLRLIKSFEKKCVNRNGSGLNQSGVSSPDAKTTTPSSFELIVGGCVILLMQEILYAYLYTWNLKHPRFKMLVSMGWFQVFTWKMFRFTKHPYKNGCWEFQV